ncbi:MAG: outer membrane beta-barrel protein [Pseudoxanthomonas sp.]
MTSNPAVSLLGVAACTATLLCPTLADAQDTPDQRWQYEFSPYLWAAGVEGDTRLGPLSFDSSANFSDIVSKLDFGAMAAFEARRGRWGVLADAFYIKLSDDRQGPQGKINFDLTQQMYLLGGTWRAFEGAAPVDLIAGLRYKYIKPRIDAPSGSREHSQEALDPFIGVRASYPLNQRWSLVGHVDVGTYDGGDWTWQLLAGAKYALSATRFVKFGYRRLETKYSTDRFETDTTLHGLYVGMGFRF